MSEAAKLREVSDEDLCAKLETLRSEIFQLRGQKLDSKTQKTHLIGQKRKEIARILTLQRERKQ
jgi:large subunit ribosomal protein L29